MEFPNWEFADGWPRRLSVRVFRNGGVEIVVPPRTSPRRVSEFVSEHREWIERQRRRSTPLTDWPLPPAELALPAIGEQWRCSAVPGPGSQLPEVLGQSTTKDNAAPLSTMTPGSAGPVKSTVTVPPLIAVVISASSTSRSVNGGSR